MKRRFPPPGPFAAAAVLSWLAAAGNAVHAADLPAHDPSRIVGQDGRFWIFSTGPGCRTAWSSNLTDWVRGPQVFANAPPWWREAVPGHRGDVWAPDLIEVGGRFLLFYSVSTFGKNTSAIGFATNAVLDPAAAGFAWEDQGAVVRSTATDDFNAIDPAPVLDAAGRLWLAFGSFWSGIRLVELDLATGRRLHPDRPATRLAWRASIEAPYLHPRADGYVLFVNWDACCRGLDSTYNIRVGRSREITGPYRDREGRPLLEGGGTLLCETRGRFIGPGHAGLFESGGTNWFTRHFYDRDAGGRPRLDVRPLRWDADGWPVLDEPDDVLGPAPGGTSTEPKGH